MRVAVLSDIHSNFYAFKACYADAVKHGSERFIFLGDYISDLSEPQRTMDLVYEIQDHYPTICLRGNREGYMLSCEDGVCIFSEVLKFLIQLSSAVCKLKSPTQLWMMIDSILIAKTAVLRKFFQK